MKKIFSILAFILFFGFVLYPTLVNAKQKNTTITITCPSGDCYTCYVPEDSPPVYKGEGTTTIVIQK